MRCYVDAVELFISKITQEPTLDIYHYRDKPQGIQFEGKKYRFKTLFNSKDLKQIFRILKYKKRSQEINKIKEHDLSR